MLVRDHGVGAVRGGLRHRSTGARACVHGDRRRPCWSAACGAARRRLAAVSRSRTQRRLPRGRRCPRPGPRVARPWSGGSRSGRASRDRSSSRGACCCSTGWGTTRCRCARREDGRQPVALSIRHHLSRRFRLRRRARARCRWSPTASSTRTAPKGSCTPSMSRPDRKSGAKTRCAGSRAEGLLRRGRLAARRGRPRARQCRRPESRRRRLRRQDRQGALDRERRSGELLVRSRRDHRGPPLRDVPDAQRTARSRSGHRRGGVPAALARASGRFGQCRGAARGRRSHLRLGRVRPRRRGAASRRRQVGRRLDLG